MAESPSNLLRLKLVNNLSVLAQFCQPLKFTYFFILVLYFIIIGINFCLLVDFKYIKPPLERRVTLKNDKSSAF